MRSLVRRLEEVGGVPASTALYSATEALRSLEAQRVAVVTPFPKPTHDKIVAFLEAEGFTVVSESRMDATFKELHEINPRESYDFVTRALKRAPRAEAGYVPCPQWHVFEMVRFLESDSGLPVITSDGGDFWYAFQRLGITDVRPGYGVLLDRLAAGAHPC